MSKTLVIAGGGTGGHVLAGVAVADAWKARFGSDAKILFVGARGGIEEKLVPRAGYPLEVLDVGRLNRVSMSERLKTVVQLPLSFVRSALILVRARPAAVLGVGGYASGPLVLIARFLGAVGLGGRAKTAILEQNSVPGMTNRILGKFVHQVFSAFPGTEAHFPQGKVQVTGNPVRAAIEEVSSRPDTRGSGAFTVFIFGGSLGAVGINTLVLEALPLLRSRIGELRIVHQTGDKDYERVKGGYAKAGSEFGGSRVEKFIYEMPDLYAAASVVICRAGSSTLAEVAAVGRAALLIPFPEASDNHQEHNARVFSGAGAAILMPQKSSRGEDLAKALLDLLDHPEKVRAMEAKVREFHHPNCAANIVEALLS